MIHFKLIPSKNNLKKYFNDFYKISNRLIPNYFRSRFINSWRVLIQDNRNLI